MLSWDPRTPLRFGCSSDKQPRNRFDSSMRLVSNSSSVQITTRVTSQAQTHTDGAMLDSCQLSGSRGDTAMLTWKCVPQHQRRMAVEGGLMHEGVTVSYTHLRAHETEAER
eukprot:3383421-Amphidinium_carterae.1